jgi:hypothetical protein
MLFWFAVAVQSVAVVPPPGPAWGRAEQVASELRGACMSEAGIRTAMKEWIDGQTSAKAQEPENVRIERELGEAAYTAPIDIKRLDRAVQARNANQAQRLAESARQTISTLSRLSPADRVIYARRLAIYHPNEPIRTCPPTSANAQ